MDGTNTEGDPPVAGDGGGGDLPAPARDRDDNPGCDPLAKDVRAAAADVARRRARRPRPVFGALRAEGPLADTFFDPLPEAELRAWEGDPPESDADGGGVADAPGDPRADAPDRLAVNDSSGNVFADLGLPDAEARLAQAELARALRARVEVVMTERTWSPADVAAHLGVSGSDLAALMRGAAARCRLGRIADALHALGMDVRLVVAAETGARGHTRVEPTRHDAPAGDGPGGAEGAGPHGGTPPHHDPADDPIVEEVRAARRTLFAEAGDDVGELFRRARASRPPGPWREGRPSDVPGDDPAGGRQPTPDAEPSAPPAAAGTGIPFDADAALVTAALGHLRHLDDPERHLMRDTPAVPPTRSGWVRQVLGALRAAGADVVYPATTDAPQPAPARGAPTSTPRDSSMSPTMQDAIGRLQALPEEAQEAIAPRLHDYLNRLEELRALIQEGIDSGPDEPLDMEAIKREARAQAEPGA